MLQFLLLLALALPTLAQIPTHQPCYYDVGKVADPAIIPCYEGGDVSPCCMRGSNCLANNACWDPGTGATYQYGCTDKTYKDGKCPSKCKFDTAKSNWVGLIYCDGTHNTPNNTWVCHHPDSCGDKCPDNNDPWSPTLEKLPSAVCSDVSPRVTAIEAGMQLGNVMNLPTQSADLASYFNAHSAEANPLPTTTSSTTTMSNSTAAPTGTSPPASTPSDPPPEESSAFTPSDNRRTALGAGLGLGLTAAVGGIVGLLLFLRRRRRAHQKSSPSPPDTPPAGEQVAAHHNVAGVGFTHKAELDGTSIPSPLVSPLSPQSGMSNEKYGQRLEVPADTAQQVAARNGNRRSEIMSHEIYELPG